MFSKSNFAIPGPSLGKLLEMTSTVEVISILALWERIEVRARIGGSDRYAHLSISLFALRDERPMNLGVLIFVLDLSSS